MIVLLVADNVCWVVLLISLHDFGKTFVMLTKKMRLPSKIANQPTRRPPIRYSDIYETDGLGSLSL
jgi:hypothetical protein